MEWKRQMLELVMITATITAVTWFIFQAPEACTINLFIVVIRYVTL